MIQFRSSIRMIPNNDEWSWMILNVDEQDGPLLFM